MGKSKDLATGETRFANVAGDTFSGAVTASVGLTIADDNNLKFGDGTAYIQGSGANDRLKFIANNTEHMRVHGSGYVTMPNQLHIFGTVKNTGGSGIANNFILNSNHPARGLSFSNSRITVPIAGVYLITFDSISGNSVSGAREDTNIYINGNAVSNSLTSNNGTGYRKNGMSIAINLSANDYIQFDSDDWYNASNGAFDAWSTASVTLLG